MFLRHAPQWRYQFIKYGLASRFVTLSLWTTVVLCWRRSSNFVALFFNFVPWPTNAQLFHKLSHSYMFRHYRVIFRELVINTLPSYTGISNAAVDNTIYNEDVSHRFYALCYQELHLKYLCNLARNWLQAPWGWHDSVETCSCVIIREIIVHLLVIVQNNKSYTVQILKWFCCISYWWRRHIHCTFRTDDADTSPVRFLLISFFSLAVISSSSSPLSRLVWVFTFCPECNLLPETFSIYMYITVQNTTHVYQRIEEIWITSGLRVSAVKQPSSGQCRTYTRYTYTVPCTCSALA